MRSFLLASLMLNTLFLRAAAQEEIPTKVVSLTPKQSADAIASASSALYSSLITSAPQQPGTGPSAGDVGFSGSAGDSDAGASGNEQGGIKLSQSGLIAIIVVIVIVCIFGIGSSVLWYLAKKRSWEVRKKLRSSARRVATALTPRRSTFPKDVQKKRTMKSMAKIDEYPREEGTDIEKGPKMRFEMLDVPKAAKWGGKGRR